MLIMKKFQMLKDCKEFINKMREENKKNMENDAKYKK